MKSSDGHGWRTAQRRNQERDRADAERIVAYLRERAGAETVDAMIAGLEQGGHKVSAWRLRALLRYLVASRRLEPVDQRPADQGTGQRRGRLPTLYRVTEATGS